MKKENIPTNLKPLAKVNENQKLPKPLIEKKRRARINRSLSDLRNLISDLLKKEMMRTRSRRKSGKVEKADVLELAVQYIKEMKQEKSVQKELAFENGYILCQQNIEEYFRKLKESNSKESVETKSECCKQKTYLVQKDLLKTLDQQWTEYVQNTNYNRKMLEEQRLNKEFDGQDKAGGEITSANDLNKQQKMNVEQQQQSFGEKSTGGNEFMHPENLSAINSNNSLINEKINTIALQYPNPSKSFNSIASNPTIIPKWRDKPRSKADELMAIKMYNEMVMHNLNRNKSLYSSASSTSSCSSGSSYAKTISSLTSGQHLLNNHQANVNQSASVNSLSHVMPVDLESSTVKISSKSSFSSSTNSSSSSVQPTTLQKISREQIKIPASIISKYSHSNSPFKKRKKIYQRAYADASTNPSDNLWRPW